MSKLEQRLKDKLKARSEKTARALSYSRALIADRKKIKHEQEIRDWAKDCLIELPARFEQSLLAEFTRISRTNIDHAANWLAKIMMQLNRCKMPFQSVNSDGAAAAWAKKQHQQMFTNDKGNFVVIDEVIARYEHVASKVEQAGFTALGKDRVTLTIEQCMAFTAKMERLQFWTRNAKIAAARVREYIAISRGLVGKHADPYCSAETLGEWKKAQQDAQEFLQSNFVGLDDGRDEELTAVISLEDASAASTANPEIRRLEMMARLRGIQEAATDEKMVSAFITWTAPSKYHYNAGVKRWSGCDPRETQGYIQNQWAKARAEIKAAGFKMAGMRVTEPHADATPHWHILAFMPENQQADIINILHKYATQDDKEELKKSDSPRFFVEYIDPAKGCAVAYIAKYISKNINGAHISGEEDRETGEAFGKHRPQLDSDGVVMRDINGAIIYEYTGGAESARAWASRWGIRQFQFFGTPPVTVWREMRRLSEPLQDAEAEAIRISTGEKGKKNASFKTFCQLMGGLCSGRDVHPVKVMQRLKMNSYGETTLKVDGLTVVKTSAEIVTRRNWIKIAGKAMASAFNWRANASAWSDNDLQGGSRAAWTRENNCKYTPEQINEKLYSSTGAAGAFVGYFDRLGEYVTEKITTYLLPKEYLWT